MLDRSRPRVSILIKAFNEQDRIAAAIESALASLEGINGEVILADSLSTDRTVEIARRYPIKIVSLTRPEDRSCGIGGQLGYQYSSGDHVCLIDGDMKLYPGFLAAALRRLESDPTLAGVGGLIVEREAYSLEYVRRAGRDDPDRRPGFVRRLDCGGVYRRASIESIGYFTDRNLHGGEEFDLGARLHAHGWRLARIDHPAIDHFGHAGSAYLLLLRRVLSRVALGAGEGLRAALGREHFWFVLRHQGRAFVLWLAVYAWWFSLVTALFVADTALHMSEELAGLILLPIAIMILRCGSANMGIYAVVAWNVNALCFLPGLLRPRVDPMRWIDSTQIDPSHKSSRELARAS